jgi:hypothetical protein
LAEGIVKQLGRIADSIEAAAKARAENAEGGIA